VTTGPNKNIKIESQNPKWLHATNDATMTKAYFAAEPQKTPTTA
jgi:hypothetical protein